MHQCALPEGQPPSVETASEQLRFWGIYRLKATVGPDFPTLNMPPTHS